MDQSWRQTSGCQPIRAETMSRGGGVPCHHPYSGHSLMCRRQSQRDQDKVRRYIIKKRYSPRSLKYYSAFVFSWLRDQWEKGWFLLKRWYSSFVATFWQLIPTHLTMIGLAYWTKNESFLIFFDLLRSDSYGVYRYNR